MNVNDGIRLMRVAFATQNDQSTLNRIDPFKHRLFVLVAYWALLDKPPLFFVGKIGMAFIALYVICVDVIPILGG